MANIRLLEGDLEQPVSESDFLQLMLERPGSKRWHSISYIQNCIVTPNTSPGLLRCNYTAPYDQQTPQNPIKYSLHEYGSDQELRAHDSCQFARKLCTIIGYYLSRVHHIVPLFVVDGL